MRSISKVLRLSTKSKCNWLRKNVLMRLTDDTSEFLGSGIFNGKTVKMCRWAERDFKLVK